MTQLYMQEREQQAGSTKSGRCMSCNSVFNIAEYFTWYQATTSDFSVAAFRHGKRALFMHNLYVNWANALLQIYDAVPMHV